MKILNWFKKRKNKKKKYSDDEYIRSSFIHADYNFLSHDVYPTFYILFEFTNSYCQSAIDITIKSLGVFIASSNDKETEELDEDGNNIIISTPKNYLLVSLGISDIYDILQNIDIANPFVYELIQQLYENANSSYFTDLINDGIMNEALFLNKEINKKQNIIKVGRIEYTDINWLLKSLPSEFTGVDLIPLFWFNIKINGENYPCNLKELIICDFKVKEELITDEEVSCLYYGVLKHPTKENLKKLIQPLYKRSIDENELINGELSSYDVDQLFKEKYDRFSAIKNDNTTYMDIDEVLSEDDPEYNNVQSNDIEDY